MAHRHDFRCPQCGSSLPPKARVRDYIRDLEHTIENLLGLVSEHAEVGAYLSELNALSHLSHNGIRRPDDLGGAITTNGASSRAPQYDPTAAAQLKAELAHLRERAETLRKVCDKVDSPEADRKRRLARLESNA